MLLFFERLLAWPGRFFRELTVDVRFFDRLAPREALLFPPWTVRVAERDGVRTRATETLRTDERAFARLLMLLVVRAVDGRFRMLFVFLALLVRLRAAGVRGIFLSVGEDHVRDKRMN